MCRKKKDDIRKFEVAFIGICTKGEKQDYRTVSISLVYLDNFNVLMLLLSVIGWIKTPS